MRKQITYDNDHKAAERLTSIANVFTIKKAVIRRNKLKGFENYTWTLEVDFE